MRRLECDGCGKPISLAAGRVDAMIFDSTSGITQPWHVGGEHNFHSVVCLKTWADGLPTPGKAPGKETAIEGT